MNGTNNKTLEEYFVKMDQFELIWESLSQFEKENITFDDFLDRMGKSLENATITEAKLIGEATRELDFALTQYPSETGRVRNIMSRLKFDLVSLLNPKKRA